MIEWLKDTVDMAMSTIQTNWECLITDLELWSLDKGDAYPNCPSRTDGSEAPSASATCA